MNPTIKSLLEILKELVPETNPGRRSYDNMRLIPVPVKQQERKFPAKSNSFR